MTTTRSDDAPTTVVLVVIDVQRLLVDELPPARRAAFLPVLQALLAHARSHGIPVVYVRHGDDELVPGSDGWQIAHEIAPHANEPIVDKGYRDAFRSTDLAAVLEALHARRLVICGMQTEYCVDATVREAERRGYGVTLVGDGHATYDAGEASEAQIRAQVHRVLGGIVTIVPSAELLAAGAGRGGG